MKVIFLVLGWLMHCRLTAALAVPESEELEPQVEVKTQHMNTLQKRVNYQIVAGVYVLIATAWKCGQFCTQTANCANLGACRACGAANIPNRSWIRRCQVNFSKKRALTTLPQMNASNIIGHLDLDHSLNVDWTVTSSSGIQLTVVNNTAVTPYTQEEMKLFVNDTTYANEPGGRPTKLVKQELLMGNKNKLNKRYSETELDLVYTDGTYTQKLQLADPSVCVAINNPSEIYLLNGPGVYVTFWSSSVCNGNKWSANGAGQGVGCPTQDCYGSNSYRIYTGDHSQYAHCDYGPCHDEL